MIDAVRVTHYKVVWEAARVGGIVVLRDIGGEQHDITVKDSAALAAPIATLRSEPHLICEPSGGRIYAGDFRPVGWIREA